MAAEKPDVNGARQHMIRMKFFAAIYLFLLGISLIVLNYYIVKDGDIKYHVVAIDESHIKEPSVDGEV